MIERAKVVLAQLEAEDRAAAARLRGSAAVRERPEPAEARPMPLHAVIAALAALHPDELSPREAMEALYELKRKLAAAKE